jgi:hypothetical protein
MKLLLFTAKRDDCFRPSCIVKKSDVKGLVQVASEMHEIIYRKLFSARGASRDASTHENQLIASTTQLF